MVLCNFSEKSKPKSLHYLNLSFSYQYLLDGIFLKIFSWCFLIYLFFEFHNNNHKVISLPPM